MGGPGGSAEVVSIAAHASYRPGYKQLASAKVLAGREALGMSHEEFADHLAVVLGWRVTPEAVEHWEQGSTPPGDVVLACDAAAGGGSLEFPVADGQHGDQVRPYSGRGLIARDQWNGIISGTTRHLWLYGMAEQGYANDDAVPGILTEAAGAGCDVRVLLLDPDSPAAAAVCADEGSPPGTLPARIRAALAEFTAMRAACPVIAIRLYDTYPTASIVRGDGEMLATPYLRYFFGANSPTFALTAESAPVMFARYERHFESMWSNAREQG